VTEGFPVSSRAGPPSVSGVAGGPPARVGHYKVLDALGSGVLTNVYRAEAEGIGRIVALKVLRTSAGRESAFFRRFEREARLLASLRHPNLIALFDFDAGVTGERPPYMVLEHVEGATLAEVIARAKRLEPDESAAIAIEVARALAYVHSQGVVHRDVKPGNVLIGRVQSRDPARGDAQAQTQAPEGGRQVVVKLVDFGIAQSAQDDDRLPHEGTSGIPTPEGSEAIGTPAYMAPEQLLGEAIDHRADQFAFGIVLYQMLAGVRPFDGDDGRPAIQRVRRDPPKAFRSMGLTIPRALERLVLRCLAKKPNDRFDSTTEIVDELARFLEGRVDSVSDLAALHRRVLGRAGVADERRALREEGVPVSRTVRSAPLRVRAIPLAPTIAGLAFCTLALVVGGAVIQWRSGGIRTGKAPPEPPKPTGVEAGDGARVRVIVRPWADIYVDGVKVETSPVARPIRVRPGKHVVAFVHPSATEKRTIEVQAGQMVTLDVSLDVPVPAYPDEFLLPEPSASTPMTSSSKGTPYGVPSTLAPK